MSKHPVLHIEFATPDREASANFFGHLFGWEVRHIPEMSYSTFSTGKDEVGGGFNPLGEGYPPGKVNVYIHTDDIDETMRRVQELGGRCLSEKMMIPTVGWFATIADPNGVEMLLLQSVMEN